MKRWRRTHGHPEEFVANLTIRKAFVTLLDKMSVAEGFQG